MPGWLDREDINGNSVYDELGVISRDIILLQYICLTDIASIIILIYVILSFKDKETEKVFHQVRSIKLPIEIQQRALVKLMLIDNAENEIDFMIPPSNRYEHLKGDRKGESSIRINDKWRINTKMVMRIM